MLSILAAILGAITTFAGAGGAPAAASFTQQMRAANGSIITFDAMDAFLTAQMESSHLPGLSIAFINVRKGNVGSSS